MRAKPELWTGAERIQWGCVLMSLLGETSLDHLHVVLAGLRSVERSRQAAPYERAVQTARVILNDLLTRNAVQSAIYEFQSEAKNRSYTIDPRTLAFTTIYSADVDSSIISAESILQNGLTRQALRASIANTNVDLVLKAEDVQVPIRLTGLQFPAPRKHRATIRPNQPIRVLWEELVDLAAQLDTEDATMGRRSLYWSIRIERIKLQATSGSGLQDTKLLDLTGLKHLIGLPGAGKTTLITLLCVLLKRRSQRVAVFFTSIEVAREYLETLRRYDVRVAILMGRSGQTHRRHANQIAELIAGQGSGGFARTREGVELFATSCPLPAFAESWPERWRQGLAPCESLFEPKSITPKLCPAWELCGRVKNQRELVEADVWLGHVISADTTVPAHTSDERYRYFELAADTFDLVIFDECDETQKVLDEFGALTLEFTGNDDSLHIALQKVTEQLAANRNRVSDDMLRYMMQANEFERHTLRFLSEIRKLFSDRRTQYLGAEYADKLLSANFLIREALVAAGSSNDFSMQALTAVSDFWERAMYRAFFFRGAEKDGWTKAEKYARDLFLDVPEEKKITEANARWLRVNDALKRYLMLDHAAEADEAIDEITTELVPLFKAPSVESIRPQVRLLIVVGFTIASYQRLAKTGRPLAQRGEMPSELTFSKASPEMREIIPRSILGAFSAVRYRRSMSKDGFEIDYLVMDTTPRLLMHRMHEFGRANVMLASATSWLKHSTEYHVDKKPDYVLSPNVDEVGTVRLYTLPKRHPSTKRPLRFSGAGAEREDNLRHMVTALAQSEVGGLSELDRAVRAVTTELGRSRKAALVVNSYEQVRLVVEQIAAVNPALADRTRGVLRELPTDATRFRYTLKGQIEELGHDQNVDVIVFPIAALGRGVNIVIRSDDKDSGKAAVGSIYFLTRPHPAAGNLSLMNSMLAQATQAFDGRDLSQYSLAAARKAYDIDRYAIYRRIANLLARPMSASSLDSKTLRHFAANLLVPILQTIGRGMRKRMPVDVYFVDAAWAPNSAEGRPESDRSSLLVVMRGVLEECFAESDPDQRDVYQALYGVFRSAFRDIIGLIPPQGERIAGTKLFDPSPVTTEIDFDGYDPDDVTSDDTQAEQATVDEYDLDADEGGEEVFSDEEYA